MQEGIVKFFNTTKGFGFITPSNGSQDIFVHATELRDEVNENDKVSFEVQDGPKELRHYGAEAQRDICSFWRSKVCEDRLRSIHQAFPRIRFCRDGR
jgi:CspA family cold shock protein